MTLKQLPNYALFTFNRPRDGYPKDGVWQKQFGLGTGVAKGLVLDYVAQAKRTPRGYTRGSMGWGGVGGRKRVTLVATRRAKLQFR